MEQYYSSYGHTDTESDSSSSFNYAKGNYDELNLNPSCDRDHNAIQERQSHSGGGGRESGHYHELEDLGVRSGRKRRREDYSSSSSDDENIRNRREFTRPTTLARQSSPPRDYSLFRENWYYSNSEREQSTRSYVSVQINYCRELRYEIENGRDAR